MAAPSKSQEGIKAGGSGWFEEPGLQALRTRAHVLELDQTVLNRFFSAMTRLVPTGKKGDLQLLLVRYRPIWTKANGLEKTVEGTIARRISQIPTAALARWITATKSDPQKATLSLAAEDSVFPNNIFSLGSFENRLKSRYLQDSAIDNRADSPLLELDHQLSSREKVKVHKLFSARALTSW